MKKYFRENLALNSFITKADEDECALSDNVMYVFTLVG